MELIEKYLYAVGKKLHSKQRNDILDELRSIIMDNLDDITGGKEATEDDVTKILLEMGEPSEVAKKYRTGPSWLIGPKYYDLYMMIVKIVMAVTAGGYILALIISLFTQNGNLGERLLYFVKEIFGIIPGLFTSIGAVTLVFAIIERSVNKPEEIDLGEKEKWSPAKLEPVPQKNEIVKPVESIVAIVFSVLAIVLLNIYRDKLGLYFFSDRIDGWQMVKIFNRDALDVYAPLWTMVCAFDIALYGWLLKTGKHNMGTKIFEMIISACSIGILFYIANGPKLFEFGDKSGSYMDFKPLIDWLSVNQKLLFTIIAVLSIIGLVVTLVKFIYHRVKNS